MDSRTWSLVSGIIIGLVLGVVVMQFVTPPLSGTSVPSHGLSTATGCVDEDDPRAWIGQVPNGDHRSVYLMNYSFVHDEPDIEVRADLNESAPGEWVLAVTTSPGNSEKQPSDDCQPRTTMDASVALPTSAETLTVTIDGKQVAIIETQAHSPRFRHLDG
ncbi:hypothetical protein [Haladaptatus sp. NG-SE-30]